MFYKKLSFKKMGTIPSYCYEPEVSIEQKHFMMLEPPLKNMLRSWSITESETKSFKVFHMDPFSVRKIIRDNDFRVFVAAPNYRGHREKPQMRWRRLYPHSTCAISEYSTLRLVPVTMISTPNLMYRHFRFFTTDNTSLVRSFMG